MTATPKKASKIKAKKLKLPHIDLKELRKQKEENLKERLEFIDQYTEWFKKTPNSEWSSQQKKIVDKA
jgi:hypothetical protein